MRPQVEELLAKEEGLTLEEAAVLVRAAADPELRARIIAAAVARREARWGRTLVLTPPLYISDGDPLRGGCQDACSYCPWANGNVPTELLLRLTPEEISAEAAVLLGFGYEIVELVAATDPLLLQGEHAARAVQAVRDAGAAEVGVNFFPLPEVDDYRLLGGAGCGFTIVWQETYVPEVYKRIHRGPKADMRNRLDAHDRSLQGGIPTAGVAFLGGLAPWQFEVLATLWHALYLRTRYRANIIFGMPRWKPGDDGKKGTGTTLGGIELSPYTDADYVFVGALYSLTVPDAMPWFSTREQFELREEAAAGGGCLFTLDCSTEVGGYTRKGFAQFPVHSRPFAGGVEWLRGRGFVPRTRLPWA
jgi:2-iminoacetate synthase